MQSFLLKDMRELFEQAYQGFPEELCYHNKTHALQVTMAAMQIAKLEGLDEEEVLELEIACLFHDAGYRDGYLHHELRGAAIAEDALKELQFPTEVIQRVKLLILATKREGEAKTIGEKIIRDADISYLGTDYYLIQSNCLRKEVGITRNMHFSDQEWLKLNLKFFEAQPYLTVGAEKLYGEKRRENEAWVRDLLGL